MPNLLSVGSGEQRGSMNACVMYCKTEGKWKAYANELVDPHPILLLLLQTPHNSAFALFVTIRFQGS